MRVRLVVRIMLKTDPKYGVYPWWPENGDDWVHPDDVATARRMIPGWRVFRRDGQEGPYVLLHYGNVRLRVLRTLWIEVRPEGFEMGDWVEVKSRGQQNTPRTGTICEMLFAPWSKRLEYQVHEYGMTIETLYGVEDMRHIEPTKPNVWSSETRH